MALPKIKYPTYQLTIPSTGNVVEYRPFTVSEEKVLLTAVQGDSEEEMYNSTKKIIETCFMNAVSIEELSSYDVEYMFINLRSKSVSNVVEMQYRHKGCEKGGEDTPVNVQINLDQAKVQVFDKKLNTYVDYKPNTKNGKGISIELEEELGVVVKHPGLDLLSKVSGSGDEITMVNELVKSCIKLVYDSEEVYDSFTSEEMDEFYDSLTSKHKEKLYEFVSNLPKLRYESSFKCPACGYEEPIIFEGFQSFFN